VDQGQWQALISQAEADDLSHQSLEDACRTLAASFRSAGRILWLGGYLLGGDRAGGFSHFDFGSDATVGLATVAQTAGELSAGAILLLDNGNPYGAAALVRQMVEVEYRAWAFAEDEGEAANWMRLDRRERLKIWSPTRFEKRSGGHFRAGDYHLHCEIGGHPTPEGRRLLTDHETGGS
jgi:hypothetical protein